MSSERLRRWYLGEYTEPVRFNLQRVLEATDCEYCWLPVRVTSVKLIWSILYPVGLATWNIAWTMSVRFTVTVV